MKNTFSIFFLVIIIWSCQEDITVYIAKEPGSLTGRILPVGIGAWVELYQGEQKSTVNVNQDGYFLFNDIAPGTYRLLFKAPDYGTREYSRVHISSGEGYDFGTIELDQIPFPLSSVTPSDGAEDVSIRYSDRLIV